MTSDETAAIAPLTDAEEAFMRALIRVLFTLPRNLDIDLLRAQGLSMTDYFTLMHLSEAPGRRLRMTDVAEAAALSLSGMTRIVQRLDNLGLVRREQSAADARSWYAILTDAGLQRLRLAWPSHLASARRHLFDHLAAIEVSDLSDLTAAFQRMADEDYDGPLPECHANRAASWPR